MQRVTRDEERRTRLSPLFVLAFAHSAQLGSVATARNGADTLLVWDASAVVTDAERTGASDEAALRTLEAEAATILVEQARKRASARTISLRVVYPRAAFGEPVYGATPAQAQVTVLTMRARRSDAVRGERWRDAFAAGRRPSGVAVTVTGSLPEQH